MQLPQKNNNPKAHKFVDYLQYSISQSEDVLRDYNVSNAMKNYKRGYVGVHGERVFAGNVLTKKHLIVYAGKALDSLSQVIPIPLFIERELKRGAKFSRIDLAMDNYITEDLITPNDYIQWYHAGKIETKPNWNKEPKFIGTAHESGNHIETLNFGDIKKRGRDGMVRAYDKLVDLGSFANAIVRLEVEDKRDNAHMSARRIADGASVGSVLKTRFNVLDERWQALIDEPEIDISRGVQKDDKVEPSDRWRYYIKQIAPELGKMIACDFLNNDNDNWNRFNEKVEIAYKKVISDAYEGQLNGNKDVIKTYTDSDY